MWKNNTKRISLLILMTLLFSAIFSRDVFAGKTFNKIVNQSYAQGLTNCYSIKSGTNSKAKATAAAIEAAVASGGGAVGSTLSVLASPEVSSGERQISTEIDEDMPPDGKFTHQSLFPNISATAKVFVPNGLTDEENSKAKSGPDAASNCYNFTSSGHDGWKSDIYSRLGMNNNSYNITSSGDDRKKIDAFMGGMGYTGQTKASAADVAGSKCYSFHYIAYAKNANGATVELEGFSAGGGGVYSPQICITSNKDGKITKVTSDLRGQSGHGGGYFTPVIPDPNGDAAIMFEVWNNTSKGDWDKCDTSKGCNYLMNYSTSMNYQVNPVANGGMKVSDFEKELNDIANKLVGDSAGYGDTTNSNTIFVNKYDGEPLKISNITEQAGGSKKWTLGAVSEPLLDGVLGYVSKNSVTPKDTKAGSTFAAAGLTESEKVVLYQYYLGVLAYGRLQCDDIDNVTPEQNWKKINWFDSKNAKKECYLLNYETKKQGMKDSEYTKYSLLTSLKGGNYFLYQGSIEEVISYLQSMTITKLEGIDEEDITTSEQTKDNVPQLTSTDEESTATYDCYSRAESLGWVLCPIIDNLGNYIQRTYEQHITNFLVLDAGLFENGGTLQAWRNFQTIANVFFVIVFLVVILSQLTGFGIDNYGIKKILPKLVVSAILINLSYFICQIAIEVANIVGYGIGQIFESIGTQVTEIKISEAASVAGDATESSGSAAGAVAIIIVLVGALVAGAVLAIGPSVLVPVFLGLIAIAIAILACFVILAVRKALAVVLVVISPVAFVCYMLPNTKSLFRRWLKAFEGVIIAFPVCSAMIYGGQAVSRLIINGSGSTTVPFMLALSAAVIAVIPMYFIPRVVSKSMGAISAGINGVANRARATGQNRARNSNAAQDLTQMSQQMRNRRAAGINWRGNETRRKQMGDRLSNRFKNTPVLGRVATARNNRIGRATNRYLSDLSENDKNTRNLTEANRDRQMFNNQVKNYMDSADFEMDTNNNSVDEMYRKVTAPVADGGIDWKTEEGRVKGRAMLKALAATKEGKKMLSSGVRSGEIAGDAYKQMAEDAGIRSAINEKDQYVAAALNSGQDWKTWYGNGDNANTRNVTKNLDKSDLYSQSGAAFQDALNQEGGKMITNERLQADMANPNIDMGDKVKDIKDMRGITASDPNAKLTEAMNNLAGEMKINRERGTLGGGYSNGPSLSGHNAQQQSKNNGGSGGGGIGNAGNIPD